MQKYQVFINQHCVFFSTKDLPEKKRIVGSFLESPTKKEIILLINNLLKQGGDAKEIVISNSSEAKAWEEFKSFFQLVKAAGGLVVNSLKEFLFIYRLGHWDLPKGKLENGESIQEAAIREIEEECGIDDMKIKKELSPTYHMYIHKGDVVLKQTHWFLMEYFGKEDLIPQKEEAIEKAIWVKRKDIEIYLSQTYASLRSMVRFSLLSV